MSRRIFLRCFPVREYVEAYQLFTALGTEPEREAAALMRKLKKAAERLIEEK